MAGPDTKASLVTDVRHMVENDNDVADGSAGSAAKFEDAYEEITLEDILHTS